MSSGARRRQRMKIRKLDQERNAARCAVCGGDDIRRSDPGAGIARRTVRPRISPRHWRGSNRARLLRPRTFSTQQGGRSHDDRGREKSARPPRGDDRESGPRSKPGKSSPRHGMAEGSVWFRAAIGRKKNAEARWLLPMICRRGGIDKHDIGAIRIMDTTTEFEISKGVANPSRSKSGVRQGRQYPDRAAGGCSAGAGGFGKAVAHA